METLVNDVASMAILLSISTTASSRQAFNFLASLINGNHSSFPYTGYVTLLTS